MSDAWDAAEKGAAARQHLIRKGWPAAAVQALPDDAIGLDTKHEKGHRLLMPLCIGDEVVDVVALGDEGVPRRRGKGRKMPILGSIDDALFHGSTGEPVFIAVRPDDYLLAQCIVAQRSSVSDHGVALGVPAVGALEDLLKLLQQGMKKLGAAPGSIELWVVRPAVHWMSNLGLVHGKSWQLTISQLEDELVQALDWARVRQSTLELLPRDLLDPAGCWSVWDSAPYMLHAGSHEWRRTKRMPGVKLQGVQMLKAYAYRLPLSTAVRATYWKNNPKFGEQRLTMPGCTEFDLGDLVATWLSTHGVQTWCDKNGQEWAYWDKALMCISGEDRAEFIARLCQLAHLNPRTRAGQAVIAQVQINARSTRDGRKRPQREVRAWSWSGMVNGVPTTAMALGDAADRVVIAQPGKVTIEPNARTNVLKSPPRPIEWQAVTASEWSALMYDKMGRWLTCEPALRLLQVSWCLMALLGRRLKAYAPVRPILWPIGPAGSAKTHVAEMVEAFFYGGRASFGTPTPASLMSMAQWRPVFAIDNAETSMRTNEMVQLLLHAFMGTVRPKMRMNSDSQVIEQKIEAWFLLTSIEGGAVHELITRSLFCRHDVIEFGDPEHDRHDPQEEIVEARDQMISGALTVWAERILPRLHAREGVEIASAYREVHPHHPLVRQLKTLASLAIISDVLADLDPRWGPGGTAALDRWLEVLGEMTGDMLSSVDPIGGGLRVLLDDFNAIDIGPNGPWQPLVETERVPLRPIFVNSKGRGVTFSRQWAKKRRSREGKTSWCPIVVGFAGSYNALHATLHERTRSRGVGYAEQVATVDILRRRMRHTSDWHTFGKIRRDATGAWLHAWVLQDAGGLGNVSAERLRHELTEADPQAEDLQPQWLDGSSEDRT